MSRRSSKNRLDIDGVLLLDKPQGKTSNAALQRVKYLLNARKAGHTGSLDPLATGLLPLCFGEATKVSSYLLDANKHYHTVARLGIDTDTGDAEGRVIRERPIPDLDITTIEETLDSFRGDIFQIPPMYSALHHNGKRLYEIARAGEVVDRPPRLVCIHELSMVSSSPSSLTLNVSCSKGTYIRSLVEDIGEALGCGAHVEVLRRTGVDPFQHPKMVTLEEIEGLVEKGEEETILDMLVAPDKALVGWSSVSLTAEQSVLMRHGRSLYWEQGDARDVLIYDDLNVFVGMGHLEDGVLSPKRLMAEAVV